jgi:hypothetical protein
VCLRYRGSLWSGSDRPKKSSVFAAKEMGLQPVLTGWSTDVIFRTCTQGAQGAVTVEYA